MTDWEHEGIPSLQSFQVWLEDGTVRSVARLHALLFFTDCVHPMQNAVCDKSRIKAWRALPEDEPQCPEIRIFLQHQQEERRRFAEWIERLQNRAKQESARLSQQRKAEDFY